MLGAARFSKRNAARDSGERPSARNGLCAPLALDTLLHAITATSQDTLVILFTMVITCDSNDCITVYIPWHARGQYAASRGDANT